VIFEPARMHGIDIMRCARCGVLHQCIHMTTDDLAKWYKKEYHDSVYTHDYYHDADVARRRIARYTQALKPTVLDVGCGNGAFVDACREIGVEAIGQDIGGYAADVYESIESMDGSFRTVTLHDVLEHVIDPKATLRSVRRLLDAGGWLIVDFPDFFSKAGRHHWKAIEHLWMLGRDDIRNLLGDAGFVVRKIDEPIPGRFVVYAQ